MLQGPCRGIHHRSQAGCHGHEHVPWCFRDQHPHAMLSRSKQALRLQADSFNRLQRLEISPSCCSNLLQFPWDCQPLPPLGRMGKGGLGMAGGWQEAVGAY